MYNQAIIDKFDQRIYSIVLRDPGQLYVLKENYLNRFNELSNIPINGSYIFLKEALDHYILKRISLKPDFIHSTEARNYIAYLKDICSRDTSEYSINIIFKTDNCLKKMFNLLPLKIFQAKMLRIYWQMKREFIVKEDDLIEFSKWLTGNLEQKKYIDTYLDYVLNIYYYSKDKKITLPVLQAIASCAQVFYCEKILENESEDFKKKFLDEGVALCKYSETDKKVYYGKCLGIGSFLSSDDFKKVTVIPKYERIYSRMEQVENTGIGGYLLVLGHELAHRYQKMKSLSPDYNLAGITWIVSVMSKDSYKYLDNHDGYLSEVNADILGWDFTDQFLSKYSDKVHDMYCSDDNDFTNHKTSIETRYEFATIDGKYFKDIQNLVTKVTDDPSNIIKYPMLKHLFNEDGFPDIISVLKCPNLDPFQRKFVKYLMFYYRKRFEVLDVIKQKLPSLYQSDLHNYYQIVSNLRRIWNDNDMILERVKSSISSEEYGSTKQLGNIDSLKGRFNMENDKMEGFILSILDEHKDDSLYKLYVSPDHKLIRF